MSLGTRLPLSLTTPPSPSPPHHLPHHPTLSLTTPPSPSPPHPLPHHPTISQMIQSLDSDLTTFRDCIQTIGTAHDNSENRKELKRLRSVIKRKIADSETKLKEESGKYVTHPLHSFISLLLTPSPCHTLLLTPSPCHTLLLTPSSPYHSF